MTLPRTLVTGDPYRARTRISTLQLAIGRRPHNSLFSWRPTNVPTLSSCPTNAPILSSCEQSCDVSQASPISYFVHPLSTSPPSVLPTNSLRSRLACLSLETRKNSNAVLWLFMGGFFKSQERTSVRSRRMARRRPSPHCHLLEGSGFRMTREGRVSVTPHRWRRQVHGKLCFEYCRSYQTESAKAMVCRGGVYSYDVDGVFLFPTFAQMTCNISRAGFSELKCSLIF